MLSTCRAAGASPRRPARSRVSDTPVRNQNRVRTLLYDPFRRGMWCHVPVENLAAFVLDDKEAVQLSERHGRHRKEIECRDHLTMIL
jgi:hypothetical protein